MSFEITGVQEDTWLCPCSPNGFEDDDGAVVDEAGWDDAFCTASQVCDTAAAEELHIDCVIDVNLLAFRPENRLDSDLPKFGPNFEGASRDPPDPGFFTSEFDDAITMAVLGSC